MVIAVVAIVVAVFFFNRPGGGPTPVPSPSGASAQQLLTQLEGISSAELDQVGAGSATISGVGAITGVQPLTSNGKPEVLYLGAEYCPYCAAERWAMLVALNRFGTFSGVALMTSSSTDVFANTATWTFHNSTFTSQYVSFVAVEQADREGKALEQPTAAQSALGQRYGGGTIPFVDFGNKLYLHGATYIPQDLQGLTWQEIISDLQDPTTSQAKEILGSANYVTAAICRATGGQPAAVCSDPVIQRLEAALPKS